MSHSLIEHNLWNRRKERIHKAFERQKTEFLCAQIVTKLRFSFTLIKSSRRAFAEKRIDASRPGLVFTPNHVGKCQQDVDGRPRFRRTMGISARRVCPFRVGCPRFSESMADDRPRVTPA